MEELKIIGKQQTNSKHFNSVDEFNLYYVKHKEELEQMTTQKLNKSFQIEGFRITKTNTRDNTGKRVKGEICLKPAQADKQEQAADPINQRIEQLEAKMKVLTSTVNKIIESINGETSG